MEPRKSRVSADLDRWADSAEEDDTRTAVVRLATSVDPQQAAERLRADGATVETAGAGSVVCRLTPDALRRIAAEPWVLAVDDPRLLFPRKGFPS